MFDIGWSEMAIIAVVALVVIGPKELPAALRTFSQWMKMARKLAREFQGGVDDIIREAELDDARKAIQATTRDVRREIEKATDPTGSVTSALNSVTGGGAVAATPAATPAATLPDETAAVAAPPAGSEPAMAASAKAGD